ncbi:MFS transporter [Terrilactibacillus sp. BCM23-1]|uniref:MFS transporter n=1 Tax=Terrilactibacillus tamarindi TaxID=2599694 RepID=A0A6N8CQ89_9BACI|nr:MFS transporter [Terrilactibacillus tamarindi]MTT32201.1 MFS transporter [Terrilactibacillus tamarindi]
MHRKTNFLIFLLAISCGSLVANLYYTQPIIEFISKDLHMSSHLSGLLTTLTQVGYGLGLFFLVPMADLIKSKKIIVTLLGITIIASAFAAIATNEMLFLFLTGLIGISACAAQILVPIAARIAPRQEIGNYVGKVMSGLLIGIMIARPLSIEITNWFGWRTVFLFSTILLLIILLLVTKFLPNFDVESENLTYSKLIVSMVEILKNTSPLKQRGFYHACLFATFSLYWTVVPILLRSLDFTNTEIALFGFVSIAGALLTSTFGKLADKGYIYSLTNVSMICVILSVGILFFVKSHSLLTIVILIISGIILDIGVSGNLIAGQKVIYSLSASHRNRLNGLYMTMFFFGGALGSFIGSYSYFQFNAATALSIGIAFPLLALLAHLVNGKEGRQLKQENKGSA